MELNAEQIKKALECCTSPDGDDTCLLCPYGDINLCTQSLMAHALALITSQEQRIEELTVELDAMRGAANSYKMHNEKLTEENERLRENNIFLNATIGKNAQQALEVTLEEIEKAKADTVRKMQELIEERLDISANGYSTDEVKGMVFDTIDQIAKEMLEGANEN